MNNVVKYGAAILGLAGLGVTGVWFWGKGAIEDEVDAQVAAIAETGWTVTWGTRSTAGFPTAYAMTLTDLALTRTESGLLVQVPEVTAEISTANTNQLDITLPPQITVRLPITEAMRVAEPALPEVLFLKIASENLQAFLVGGDPSDPVLEIVADSLRAEVAQDDYVMQVGVAAEKPAVRLMPKAGQVDMTLTAGALQLLMDWPSDIERPKIEAGLTSPDLSLSAKAESWQGFLDAYGGAAEGLFASELSASAYLLQITPKVGGETQTAYETANAGLKVGLDKGVLRYEAIDETPVLDIRPRPARSADGQATDEKANDDKATRIAAARFSRALTLPLGPAGQGPQPTTLTMSLTEAGPDPDTWGRIDPDKVLPRDPGMAQVDLVGTMAYVREGVWGLPVEFNNITVKDISVQSMGATASLTGDVEILQPVAVPFGALSLALDRPQRLLGQLLTAGLLPQAYRDMGNAMLEVYAVPGDEADRFKVPIDFTYEGIKVNGRRVP